MRRTVVLVILDGWGIGRNDESNPIYVVKPEFLTRLGADYPLTSLQASGISVGLPWGEVGNSEVGHLTLGAGKVIYQYFPLISLSIREGSFFKNKALTGAFSHAKNNGSAVNLVGLLTRANVHASLEHLEALIVMAGREKTERLNLHLLTDGKDSPPRSALEFIKNLPAGSIGSLSGRYYAMDRDGNWQLVRRAYEAMTGLGPSSAEKPEAIIARAVAEAKSEEFLAPVSLDANRSIRDGDAVIFFNFREDGMRELSEAFVDKKFSRFPVKKFKNIHVAAMTRYEKTFGAPVAFEPDIVTTPLGKILSDGGRNQLRVAETYKYAHVTYFFNGYREEPFPNEYRVLIPSLTTPRVDEHPKMMAPAITDRVIQGLENRAFDFILANYANPDSIAHTENYSAALEAVSVIDEEIGRIVKAIGQTETVLMITSDHGNIEQVLNPLTAEAETQHDPNPVPFYLVGPEFKGRKFVNAENLKNETAGILSDVAPTILDVLGLRKPDEMTGQSLTGKLV